MEECGRTNERTNERTTKSISSSGHLAAKSWLHPHHPRLDPSSLLQRVPLATSCIAAAAADDDDEPKEGRQYDVISTTIAQRQEEEAAQPFAFAFYDDAAFFLPDSLFGRRNERAAVVLGQRHNGSFDSTLHTGWVILVH
jgi:hypothetical protein